MPDMLRKLVASQDTPSTWKPHNVSRHPYQMNETYRDVDDMEGTA